MSASSFNNGTVNHPNSASNSADLKPNVHMLVIVERQVLVEKL
jgi:hypothetical protein